jgi:hypothetical protein
MFSIKLKFYIHPNVGRLSNRSKKLLFGIFRIFLVDLNFFFLFDLELFYYVFSFI